MKKKYFFVIFFLMLAIFSTINTSNVNAIMCKILDSKGNIIRITSQPMLSIKEKEAGYTVSPPPGENIDVIQGQVTTSGSDKYDFRETNWGYEQRTS